MPEKAKLPSDNPSQVEQQPRRWGRPRKTPLVVAETAPRKRGRPRKPVDPDVPPRVPKRRGRPRKPDAKYPTVADMKSFRRKWSMIDMLVHPDQDHPDGYTVDEMAELFDVTSRTIRRDLKILDDIFGGLDVKRVRWGLKRYYLERIPFGEGGTAITREELVALCIARLLMRPFRGTPLATAIDSGFQKLLSCLSKESVDYAEKVSSFFLQFSYNADLTENQAEILTTLFSAMEKREVVKFTYFSVNSREVKVYEVHPYSFIYDKGFIYLLGYNCKKDRFQHWKLNRFKKAESLNVPFQEDHHFDLESYSDKAINMFLCDDDPVRVRVIFSSRCALDVKEQGLAVIKKKRFRKDGSLEVEMMVDPSPAFVNWILSFGDNAKVMSPRSVRAQILEEANKLAARYRLG